jgi:EAL domain-containing protein (putative c-di-GMP-specific phosphodiesterase class I)
MLTFGFASVTGNDFNISTENWQAAFALIRPTLSAIDKSLQPEISLFCGNDENEIHKTFAEMCALSDSVWLGEALQSSRLVCYMQPVCTSTGDVIGYESFARVKMEDGSVLAGDKIMQAGKMLSIEFAMDKFLHTQAIATFATHQVDGFLFVNFFPGFIQRPAIYLEGLLAAAQYYHISPNRLVLDLTQSETRSDVGHLAKVCDYAKAQGCKIALDDVESLTNARKLLPITKADFIKIDRDLVHKSHHPGEGAVIASMVELAREHGAKTIGEGVETKDQLAALTALGVDFFQGYYFAAPMAVEQILAQKAS